jgi:serine/threonine-protein kinase
MRASLLLRIVVALAGIAVGAALTVWLVLSVSLRSSAARVPSVVGMDPARAAAALLDAGLVARAQDGVFDPEVPAGKVARQRPTAGFQLKRGGTVLIFPSLGEASQRVEDLVGLPVSLADSELETAGLSSGVRCEVDGQADSAEIVASTPAAGVLVAPGTAVALLVNRAPRQQRYAMPDLGGVSEADATRVLRALGFRVGTAQRLAYPGIPPGVVLRQEPSAGGPVAEGGTVNLWVSL